MCLQAHGGGAYGAPHAGPVAESKKGPEKGQSKGKERKTKKS